MYAEILRTTSSRGESPAIQSAILSLDFWSQESRDILSTSLERRYSDRASRYSFDCALPLSKWRAIGMVDEEFELSQTNGIRSK